MFQSIKKYTYRDSSIKFIGHYMLCNIINSFCINKKHSIERWSGGYTGHNVKGFKY